MLHQEVGSGLFHWPCPACEKLRLAPFKASGRSLQVISPSDLTQMMRISSAASGDASGEEVATVAARDFSIFFSGRDAHSRLAEELVEGAVSEALQVSDPNSEGRRDIAFLKSCQQGDMEEVERNLQGLQNPNVDLEGWHESPLSLA